MLMYFVNPESLGGRIAAEVEFCPTKIIELVAATLRDNLERWRGAGRDFVNQNDQIIQAMEADFTTAYRAQDWLTVKRLGWSLWLGAVGAADGLDEIVAKEASGHNALLQWGEPPERFRYDFEELSN